jgi:hypothetical protein
LSKEDDLPDINDFPVITPQLSSSAPLDVTPWSSNQVGDGSLALPNQAILPEDSRPRRVIPEVSLIQLSPLLPPENYLTSSAVQNFSILRNK